MCSCAGSEPVLRPVVGILLAAGRGRRFDPSGHRNKLLQLLPQGTGVAEQSAITLASAVDKVWAVVPPDSDGLAATLRQAHISTVPCSQCDLGMAESLKAGVLAAQAGAPVQGWVVALADMPFVQPETVRLLVQALRLGARVAVPVFEGRRGNPVAFSYQCLPDLLALQGDTGARSLLGASDVQRITVNDPGILRDIDQPSDL